MTVSEIMKMAHQMTRDERRRAANRGEAFCYRTMFAEMLAAAYVNAKRAPVTTGFFIKEPWYKRQMWVSQRSAGWVTL